MELLLVSLVKASLVLALAQLLVLALPALSAAMKHLLLTAGIAAFVFIPLLAAFGPVWEVTVESDAPPVVLTAPAAAAAVPASPHTPAPHTAAPPAEPARVSLFAVAVSVWLLIAFAVVARLVRTALHLRSTVLDAVAPSPRLAALLGDVRERLGIGGSLRLLRSDRINVPMVWGIRSGTLLMPEIAEEWTDEHLRATFIHELGHLRRLDYVSLALMNAVSAVLWFHPQVWLARRRAMTEGERACDDLVLTAGERASEYATHLLHVARLVPRREPLAALLAMSRPSQLEGRMVAILSPSTNRKPLGGKALMISMISFVALVVPFALVQLSAQPVAVSAPVRPVRPAVEVVVAAPVAAARLVHAAAPVAAPAPVAIAVEAPEPPPLAEPVEWVDVAAPVAPAPEAIEVSVAPVAEAAEPAATSHVAPTPMAEEEAEEDLAAPVAPPALIPVLTEAQLASRPYELIKRMTTVACTLRLARPVNTGEPGRNPAEELAMARLLRKAQKGGADAVTNVRCYRYVAIGITCPTGIECNGDAIKFTSPSR